MFCLISKNAISQTSVLAHSPNLKFYLLSVSYSENLYDSLGKTTVFSEDSVELYSFERFFPHYNNTSLILSNDGKTICYIKGNEWTKEYKDQVGIALYDSGQKVKEYRTSELVNCDDDYLDCSLTFNRETFESKSILLSEDSIYHIAPTDFERFLFDTNVFIKNDTVYVFSVDDSVVVVDLANGTYFKKSFSNFTKFELLKNYSIPNIQEIRYDDSQICDFPHLKNGKSIEKLIAHTLQMRRIPLKRQPSEKYYEYVINLECLIDKEGKGTISNLETSESLPEEKIIDVVSKAKFKTRCLLKHADKTSFSLTDFRLRDRSKKQAIMLRIKLDTIEKIRLQQDLAADTINGFYIPKDIEDCFFQLDILLKPKDKIEMKVLKKDQALARSYDDIGTFIRNKWGLWSGSRLQSYFIKRGIPDPDSMSMVILSCYYDWVNKKTESWKIWESEHPVQRK
jgi:hypothetical protein